MRGALKTNMARKLSEADTPLKRVPPDLVHLVPGFWERRESEIGELTDLLKNTDFKAIKYIGHRLKGIGVGYGFPEVSEIGRKLEEAAGLEKRDEIQAEIGRLVEVTRLVKQWL